MKPDIPPLRGLDQNAGDVDGGVIGSPKRLRRAVFGAAVAFMAAAAVALIAWWV
jgi:hypothetical protein